MARIWASYTLRYTRPTVRIDCLTDSDSAEISLKQPGRDHYRLAH